MQQIRRAVAKIAVDGVSAERMVRIKVGKRLMVCEGIKAAGGFEELFLWFLKRRGENNLCGCGPHGGE